MAYAQQKSGMTRGKYDPVTGRAGHAHDGATAQAGRELVATVLAGYQGSVAVRLWNGELVTGTANAPCILQFRQPAALRELILHRDLLRLAAAYLRGEVDVEGDLEHLFTLGPFIEQLDLSWRDRLHLLRQAFRLPARELQCGTYSQRSSGRVRANTPASIAHHYDVGNEFYALWLDPEMVYSCAYFSDEHQSLAAAQQDKLDYLCRKLRLSPGQTLLDIGCGWGALALWAAQHYGVRVHGITLSREQCQHAQARAKAAGLERQVRIERCDYRDLAANTRYDRVISVGMFEHVGVRNFPRYFDTVRRVLRPGGLFLNHGITSENGWQRTPLTHFMNHYIFPDGELARVGDVIAAMEQAGFEIVDVEGLRRHYPQTLRHWVRALEASRSTAIALAGETTYRLWRLYMAGCAHYFEEGSLGVHQVLAGCRHAPLPVPLRRNDLYTTSGPLLEVTL